MFPVPIYVARSESLPPQCIVFSAEAATIFVAATLPANKPIAILTDSAGMVAAQHPWIQGILAAGMAPDTCFAWIHGHCGNRLNLTGNLVLSWGNVEADAFACVRHEGSPYTHSVPLADVIKWTKSVVGQDWARVWNSNNVLPLKKMKGTTGPWHELTSQKEQTIMSRLRTGHSRVSHNFG